MLYFCTDTLWTNLTNKGKYPVGPFHHNTFLPSSTVSVGDPFNHFSNSRAHPKAEVRKQRAQLRVCMCVRVRDGNAQILLY